MDIRSAKDMWKAALAFTRAKTEKMPMTIEEVDERISRIDEQLLKSMNDYNSRKVEFQDKMKLGMSIGQLHYNRIPKYQKTVAKIFEIEEDLAVARRRLIEIDERDDSKDAPPEDDLAAGFRALFRQLREMFCARRKIDACYQKIRTKKRMLADIKREIAARTMSAQANMKHVFWAATVYKSLRLRLNRNREQLLELRRTLER